MAPNAIATSNYSKVRGITIRSNGIIGIHRGTAEKYGLLLTMKFASLNFDAFESVLTITVAEKSPTTFEVLRDKESGLKFKCLSFLDEHQIPFRKVSRAFPVVNGEEGKEIRIKVEY